VSTREWNRLRMPCVRLEDRAGIAVSAFKFARRMGFDQRACWEIGIAVQELASNIVRHAGGGHVELHAGAGVLEVIAIDAGPGIPPSIIAERESWVRGLGAVKRLMHELEINSATLEGTRICAKRYMEPRT
jgi:anti-sigma regulatory factor (Ser/Thr protein kinase)